MAYEWEQKADESEDEGIDEYKKGGHHPAFVGEILNSRYVVLEKLGLGEFSTVWLARDTKANTFVAIKIMKSEVNYLEASFDEVELLQKTIRCSNGTTWKQKCDKYADLYPNSFATDKSETLRILRRPIVKLLNSFILQGHYGRHFCMVFQVLGPTLQNLMKRFDGKGVPINICRTIARQLLIGLHFLHDTCSIIHTDLKPENIVFEIDKRMKEKLTLNSSLRDPQTSLKRFNQLKKHAQSLKSPQMTSAQREELARNILMEQREAVASFNPADLGLPADFAKSNPAQLFLQKEKFASFFYMNENSENDEKEGPDNDIDFDLNTNDVPILTEDDFQREYERLAKQKNLKTKKELKNLRKKLKKKLKKNRTKVEMIPNHEISLRLLNVKREKKIAPKVRRTPSRFSMPDLSSFPTSFGVKIIDLGRSCWKEHHFLPDIQARNYRAPEIILGVKYNETVDIWSLACIMFEMVIGEKLFNPKKDEHLSVNEDHLALMIELLNRFPQSLISRGFNSRKYFDNTGNLKKVHQLNYMSLYELLIKIHRMKPSHAKDFASFLEPMLNPDPLKRASAKEMLNHPWLNFSNEEAFYGPEEQENFMEMVDSIAYIQMNFRPPLNEEEFDADTSFMSSEIEISSEDEHENEDFYTKEVRFFDKSFKQGYGACSEGFDVNDLDNTIVWLQEKQAESVH